MATHTTIELNGSTIQVIPDDAWTKDVGGGTRGALLMTDARRLLVQALADGPLEDTSGQATILLHERMVERGYTGSRSAVTPLMRQPWAQRAVAREVRGKRMFWIALERLPQRYVAWLPPEALEPDTTVEEEAPLVEEEPTPARPAGNASGWWTPNRRMSDPRWIECTRRRRSATATSPRLRLVVSTHVAAALLTKCVEIISTADADKRAVMDRDDARRRLADAMEHGEKLRRQLREVGEELGAVKQERDGLRNRLHMAEANVAKLSSPNGDVGRIVDEMVRVELAKVMRAAPAPGRGGS